MTFYLWDHFSIKPIFFYFKLYKLYALIRDVSKPWDLVINIAFSEIVSLSLRD